MTVTLGEFVAASNAKLIGAYFVHEGDIEAGDAYDRIQADELRHYGLMRRAVGNRGHLPAEMRQIYKGALLDVSESLSLDCVFERMAVMHTVAEGLNGALSELPERVNVATLKVVCVDIKAGRAMNFPEFLDPIFS